MTKIEVVEGNNESITEVEAEIFEHPLDKKIKFAVHKTVTVPELKDNTWSITHIATGCCLDKGYSTKESALEDAINRLKNYRVTKNHPDALKNFKTAISEVPSLNKVKLDILYKEKK